MLFIILWYWNVWNLPEKLFYLTNCYGIGMIKLYSAYKFKIFVISFLHEKCFHSTYVSFRALVTYTLSLFYLQHLLSSSCLLSSSNFSILTSFSFIYCPCFHYNCPFSLFITYAKLLHCIWHFHCYSLFKSYWIMVLKYKDFSSSDQIPIHENILSLLSLSVFRILRIETTQWKCVHFSLFLTFWLCCSVSFLFWI